MLTEPVVTCLDRSRCSAVYKKYGPRAPIALAAPMARLMAVAAVAALGLSEAPVYEPVHGRLQATMSGGDLVLGEVAIEPQQQDALFPLVVCEVQPPADWLTARGSGEAAPGIWRATSSVALRPSSSASRAPCGRDVRP